MTDTAVLQLLQNEVKTAVANSNTPDLPIKFLGRSFNPPSDDKFLDLIFIPNNQDNYWNGKTLFQGIFRMGLNWPLNDAGVYTPMNNITSIASHFRKDTPLHSADISLQIYRKPLVEGMLTEDARNVFPASLLYRSFQT